MKVHHRLITLWRIMVAGTRNFFRNAWLSAASTAVMMVTLTVMLTAVILNFALNDTVEQVTAKIDIAIFFEDGATSEQATNLEKDLQALDNVTSTTYVDKTEALRRYREQNKDKPELLEAVSEQENPLPTSLEVRVKDLNNIEPIIRVTQKDEYLGAIQDTSFGEDRQKTIARIASFKRFLIQAGIIGSLVFATIAVLIIFNTIRMAIFSRREELEIMRLIGATNGYIRGPFVFEAMLDGLIAAVIALVFGYALLFVAGPKLVSYIDFRDTLSFFEQHWTLTSIITMASGMLIGIGSSLLAMARYLKL